MRLFFRLLFAFLFVIASDCLVAQTRGVDTAYVRELPTKMALRTYLSKKYTEINYGQELGIYEPNSGLNLGLGMTFQKFTLNIGVPYSFMNPNRIKQWPASLDLQAHAYPNRWIFDFFGQFYNGYTMKEGNAVGEDYLREDVSVVKLGLGANYLFNGDKISLEAAFLQSAIQKRSAFSPMFGLEVYRVRISGDSLLIPTEMPLAGNYQRADFYQVGPSGGLVGTLVFGRGFFLTGAASANLALGISKGDQNKETREVGLVPSYFLRGFAGYNGERYSINVNYLYKHLNLAGQQDVSQSTNTGNYRLNLIYRIQPGPKFTEVYTKLNPWNILQRILDNALGHGKEPTVESGH
ncbi:DUF4421 domain-containing protein [Algoriphagus sp. H41]|uniref:DUF4421 domain-containing protein n=1 Tax=Algoriphagus oliviformis TaxID=2811231 RepID=A0ABS3C5C1_9BACT|nr:DUF4421 domain-containing protein [Algoriphagus oliviformis]MBN7811784.1 DUF4421 domain-containing protein [Algoriphagus oliviformis]